MATNLRQLTAACQTQDTSDTTELLNNLAADAKTKLVAVTAHVLLKQLSAQLVQLRSKVQPEYKAGACCHLICSLALTSKDPDREFSELQCLSSRF